MLFSSQSISRLLYRNMSKLYGDDEGYEVMVNRSTMKKLKKVEDSKRATKSKSRYNSIRKEISDLICDQEPVLHGPPFNEIIDLASLTHDEFVARASMVMTVYNPEGRPPSRAHLPPMNKLIDALDDAKDSERESYASVADPNRKASPVPSTASYNGSVLSADRSEEDSHAPETRSDSVLASVRATAKRVSSPQKVKVQKAKRPRKVSFAASASPLQLESKRSNQYAISTIACKSAMARPQNKRQCVNTDRLGLFHKGTKQIASSALSLMQSSSTDTTVQPIDAVIDFERTLDDNISVENSPTEGLSSEGDSQKRIDTRTDYSNCSRRSATLALYCLGLRSF